jgi:Cadherin-like/Putative Ig domain/FG-GAP repeat
MKGQFPAVFNLTDLNGQNGFKLDGENAGDYSGSVVSAARDINGDGYADILIGAVSYPAGSNKGRSYVVFGGPGVGSNGTIALSSLNGVNGFKLDGENNNDRSTVKAAGDINGDGHVDILLGAYGYPVGSFEGRSYVVLGGVGVGSSGTIALSSLNGANGFKVNGENDSDDSGVAVKAAGDINGDGYVDLLIGAPGYPASGANGKGRSYVVFGGPGVGSNGTFALSSLNATNGLKLDGENSGDWSGVSVSAVGDINGDGHVDLLIGTNQYPPLNSTGRSYVVFGGSGVSSNGILALSSLNGTKGFKLDGENNNDGSGDFVNAAGDINGDGHADLVIGADRYPAGSRTGRSYVVFGGPGVGSNGTLALSSLNGANGFKLDGEHSNDNSGYPVSTAGDINGDGYADLLIAAPGYPAGSNKGRSYIVFGRSGVSSHGTLALSSLNGTDGFKLDGENNGDQSGSWVSAAGDINGDGIDDLLIGAYAYPSGSYKGRTYVVFGDAPPVLVNNKLNIIAGNSVVLSYINLGAYDRNHNNQTLVFAPSAVQNGYFSTTSAPSIPLVNFTQQQISNGTIQFVHDGTQNPPSYNMSVYSPGIAWTGPWPAQISFNLAQSYFPTILPLGSLNGQNGFKLDGENNNDQSGISVSNLGDINHDGHADLWITAGGWNTPTGRGYVLFGGPGVGSSGEIALGSLNGIGGFKLDGESGSCLNAGRGVGDINGDNISDLIMGGPCYATNQGRSYVVFGGLGVGSSGDIALGSLNGTNGFKIDAEASSDGNGGAVNGMHDINGDGRPELLIGAPNHAGIGRSYVVFGGVGIGSSGDMLLSNIGGSNGFKLDGESNGDNSGNVVNGCGDINGDGIQDLAVAANCHLFVSPNCGAGRSYVVFGGSGVGSSSDIALASLNGTNGFKLDGENSGDSSRIGEGSGDVNGDGYDDLIIGAGSFTGGSNKGRSYVVFGGPGVGSNGIIALGSLNGTNGFKLDGENNGDQSGVLVRIIGDINEDGYDDLGISANGYPGGSHKGRGYVVFGGPEVGNAGIINLSSLNGVNGFKLDGENNNDVSGVVRQAGDINGDGVADLTVAALGYPAGNNIGRTYVLFGDVPPVLVNNSLKISIGAVVLVNSNNLSAYDLNNNNNTILFVPTGVSHGQFELVTQPGISLVNFTQPQLVNGSVQFVHDGSAFAPGYNITVYSAGIAWTGPSAANITLLPATTPTITASSTPVPTTSTPIVITGTPTPSPTPTPTPTITPTSTIIPTPVLVNNQLTIGDGQTVVLSSTNLQAIETGFSPGNLTFYISNLQSGYFSLLPTNASVTRFLQSYVQNGQVQFVHSGDHQAPGYSVVVSDGSQVTTPSSASIDFIGAPSITTTPVTITPGGSTTLTTDNLNATNTGSSSSNQIVFQVSNVQNGQFVLNGSSTMVTNFTLTQLIDHSVQLVQDSSNIAPSYSVSVTGNTGLSSAATPVTAQLCTSLSSSSTCAPMIVRNNLWVKQGESATLSSQNLYATTTSGQTLPASTVFYITNVNHGYFKINGSSSSFFTEQQLQEEVVQFIDDGSNIAPSYQIAVQSSGLQTNSFAQVTLGFVNKPPYLSIALLNQVAVVGQPFSLSLAPNTFTDPQGDPLILSAGIYNGTQFLPGWLSFNPGTNRFSGTPTESGVVDIGITATDPEGLSTEGEFSLTVLNQSSGGNNSLTTTIASSVVSGSIGLLFLLLKLCLQRAANKKLDEALGDTKDYEQKVVRPLGRAIAQRLKITGFMGNTTKREMVAFKDAIGTLLGCLSERGINLEDTQMSDSRRAYLINEIAMQTKEYFLPSNRNCCQKSYRSVVSFFTSEVTPHQITTAAAAIADAVVQSQKQHKSSVVQLGMLSSSQSGVSQPASPSIQQEEVVAGLS